MFIFREEQYRDADGQPNQEAEGTAEIIIGKQRNGPVGTVKLAFIRSTRASKTSRRAPRERCLDIRCRSNVGSGDRT
jgi:replicative DNA helicase